MVVKVVQRKAFSYTRFSDPKQAKGRSAQRQIRRAERWAARNKLILDLSLGLLDEGLSGYWGDHMSQGSLGRFLALCGTPVVPAGSVLIVEDFDRLSRQVPDDAWELFRQILLAGVEIAVLTLGKWFTRASLNSFEDRVLVQASQHRAHEESRLKADRLRDVWRARRKRAKKGKKVTYTNIPGWMVKRGKRQPILHPERTATIQEMVRLHRVGLGVDRIAGELAAQAEQHPCWMRAGRWTGSGIHDILASEAIWGAYQPHRYDENRKRIPAGDVVRNHYPAVLSEEEAAAIRRKLSSRRRSGGRPSSTDRGLLRKLVRDAESGQWLRCRPSKKQPDGSVQVYLDRNVGGKRQVMIEYFTIQSLLLRLVQKWVPEAFEQPTPGPEQERARRIEIALKEVAERKAEIREAIREAKAGAVATLASILEEVIEQEEDLRHQLEESTSAGGAVAAAAAREAKSLAVQFETATAEEKPQLRQALHARLLESLEGVWLYRQDLGYHKAAVYVQVWPRAGKPHYAVCLVGRAPEGWEPLALDPATVDLRLGYPAGKYSTQAPSPRDSATRAASLKGSGSRSKRVATAGSGDQVDPVQ